MRKPRPDQRKAEQALLSTCLQVTAFAASGTTPPEGWKSMSTRIQRECQDLLRSWQSRRSYPPFRISLSDDELRRAISSCRRIEMVNPGLAVHIIMKEYSKENTMDCWPRVETTLVCRILGEDSWNAVINIPPNHPGLGKIAWERTIQIAQRGLPAERLCIQKQPIRQHRR